MLKHLTIKNYALIESLESDFFDGFSVMTGETGAGKSIILGALSLILGQRADLQALKDKHNKCVVEGVFNTAGRNFEDFFRNNNLDYDSAMTILRREILPSGKSRAFINDTPVSLVQLRELAGSLVDLHSQNSATLLQSPAFQLGVLDNFCKNGERLAKYKKLYREFRQKVNEMESLRDQEQQAAAEQDFIRFQYEELDKARLVAGEQDDVEQELGVLVHAGEIKTRLVNVLALMEEEHGLKELFGDILAEFKPLKNYSAELAELYSRIESNYLEMSDVSEELSRIDDRVEVSPERAEELNERLNLIYHLEQKHRVKGVEELIRLKDDYREKLGRFESLGDEIAKAEKQVATMRTELSGLAGELSKVRAAKKSDLENKLTEIVTWLGMPDATVKIDLGKSETLTETGADRMTLMFSANKGMQIQEMARVASGGELSRLMLAIKSQIAVNNLVSTIIFDEIDSGVSGEVAGKMAGIMQQLGGNIQVISITHLPQIAARGRHHYQVTKESNESTTTTSIRKLTQDERITEIAKMLSDTTVSSSAIQTAEELMKN